MEARRQYQIVLLPRCEVAQRGHTIGEAAAWIKAYNEIMRDEPRRAVIAEEQPPRAAA